MKSFRNFAIAITFYSSSISATPTPTPRVTVTITNELDNQTGSAFILGDSRLRQISHLFVNTELDQNGQFFGTSARLTQSVDNTRCLIRSIDGDIHFNSSVPLIDLNENANITLLKPIVLNGLQIRCQT
jgi:hypothetical protein